MASPAPVLRDVALDDKYALDSGRVYLNGVQALVRLLILQRQRDKAAGLNTGGFVSGYRGSRSAVSTRRCGRLRSSSTARTSGSSRA